MYPKTNKIQTLSFLCFFICNFPIFLKYFYRLGKSVCIKIINHLAISADMFWHSCFRMLHANSLLGLLRLLELCWCHIVIKWFTYFKRYMAFTHNIVINENSRVNMWIIGRKAMHLYFETLILYRYSFVLTWLSIYFYTFHASKA